MATASWGISTGGNGHSISKQHAATAEGEETTTMNRQHADNISLTQQMQLRLRALEMFATANINI